MRALTPARLALLAAAVAAVAFLPALANGWALDDVGVIERNPRAHEVGAALRGFFAPYWPVSGDLTAGLWRPLVILSYAVDYSLAGGAPWLAHLSNVLWHALATGLVVLVAAAWLRGWPLLVAGLVFALHPVHVEAVANVVGRAELMAAALVLATVLAARRHRAAAGTARLRWGVATVGLLGLGLLVKEHAIVALPLVAVDGWLARGQNRADAGMYLAMVALVLGWLHLWRAIAGGFVVETVAAPLRGLDAGGRLAFMLPITLDVLRLLVWPFDLAADYNPLLVSPDGTLSVQAVLGGLVLLALLGLALASVWRAPAVAFGILAAGLAWGPTSNLLVPSGIVLSERTLYLPSLGVALVAGWLVTRLPEFDARIRRLVVAAAGLLAIGWVARIETRIPFWHDTRSVVIEDYLQHPQNYRAHARVGSVFEITGDTASALREFLTATALYPDDHVLTLQVAGAALAVGARGLAVAELRRGWSFAPGDPVLAERLAHALAAAGQPAEALEVLAGGIERNPGVVLLEDRRLALLESLGAAAWQRDLVRARSEWLRARPAAARVAVARAASALPTDPPRSACYDLRQTRDLARNLLLPGAAVLDSAATKACSGD